MLISRGIQLHPLVLSLCSSFQDRSCATYWSQRITRPQLWVVLEHTLWVRPCSAATCSNLIVRGRPLTDDPFLIQLIGLLTELCVTTACHWSHGFRHIVLQIFRLELIQIRVATNVRVFLLLVVCVNKSIIFFAWIHLAALSCLKRCLTQLQFLHSHITVWLECSARWIFCCIISDQWWAHFV